MSESFIYEPNESSPEKRVYTVAEIQSILGISRPTAYKLIKKDVFRSIHIGGSIRISKKSFDAWFDSTDHV